MSTTSRVIWFNENDVSFKNDTTGTEFKSGDSVTVDSTNTSTTFRITLKDSSKHWPTGSRAFLFIIGDPENPVTPNIVNGFDNVYLNNNYFTFTSSDLYNKLNANDTTSQDKEISFHFNALLDSNNDIIQQKDIVTNNPNVIASAICSSYTTPYYNLSTVTDTVTITAKTGYKITSVKMYDRSTGSAKFTDYTSSLDSNGNLNLTFRRDTIPKGINAGLYNNIPQVWGYFAKVTTVPTSTPTTPTKPTTFDLTVKYNNGLADVTDTFTLDKSGDKIVNGTITAGTGYTITGVTGARYSIRPGQYVTVSDFVATKISDYQYSYTFKAPGAVNITASVQTKKIPGNINIDTTGLVNCSVSPATITQGTQTVLTLNANSSYILNGSGTYTVDGTTTNFTCTNASSYPITVTANTSVSIIFSATKTETPPSSITHTYVLTQDDYNQLGKQIIDGVNSTGTGFELYDYTKFVNYLYQIPFNIGTDITTSSSSINLGKKSIDLDCRKVTHETLTIDLGSIDLTNISNSNDLKPISTTLYSPFSENINLPPTVLGSKLYLSFSINLKTEQGLLLIKQNDNIIHSGQTELFTDLPLYYTAGNQDTLVRQFKAQYQNVIKQAYVVVNYNKPITNLTSYQTNEHGTLSSYKGFTRVTRGTLKQSVNSTIDQSLLNLLRQGVIIK